MNTLEFHVDVLYNSDIEWHEAFSVVLGPTPPVGAELGTINTATITILDNDVSGSIVLPAAPIVSTMQSLYNARFYCLLSEVVID